MRSILFLSALALSTLAKSQETNPFDTVSYDKVVAYEFRGEGARKIKYCLEKEPRRILKSVELSDAQLGKFTKLLTTNSSYGGTTAACFDPHLALVYYEKDEIVASIDICLGCNYLSSSIEIPATKHQMIKIDEDLSLPAKGFSKGARKSIHQFCREIGFTRFLRPLESMFDQE